MAARFTEFGEIDVPRFQVGFPPQHLLLTLLGDYWSRRCEPLPSAALVDLLAEFDVNPSGARAALSRLSIRGLLVGTKDGRNTFYRVGKASVICCRTARSTPARLQSQSLTGTGCGPWSPSLFPRISAGSARCCVGDCSRWGLLRCTTGCGCRPTPPTESSTLLSRWLRRSRAR